MLNGNRQVRDGDAVFICDGREMATRKSPTITAYHMKDIEITEEKTKIIPNNSEGRIKKTHQIVDESFC